MPSEQFDEITEEFRTLTKRLRGQYKHHPGVVAVDRKLDF
jgi:hypothetical protein